jgi:hypothetical protein
MEAGDILTTDTAPDGATAATILPMGWVTTADGTTGTIMAGDTTTRPPTTITAKTEAAVVIHTATGDPDQGIPPTVPVLLKTGKPV